MTDEFTITVEMTPGDARQCIRLLRRFLHSEGRRYKSGSRVDPRPDLTAFKMARAEQLIYRLETALVVAGATVHDTETKTPSQ